MLEKVASKPKFKVSVGSMATMPMGTMLHVVQSGALMPATACAAILVLADWPPGRRLQKVSGASAVTLTCTNCAVGSAQSVELPLPEVASVTVAKQAGGLMVLVRLPPPTPTGRDPKL